MNKDTEYKLRYEKLAPANTEALSVFERMFLATFPPSQRDTMLEFIDNLESEVYQAFLAYIAQKPVGYYVMERLRGVPISLLSYVAVEPRSQGNGIGSLIVRHVINEHFENFSGNSLFLEAEAKQARWYLGFGFLRLGLNYKSPHLDGEGATPMSLMVHRDSLSAGNVDLIPQAKVQAMIESLLRQSYQLSSDDPRLTRQLNAIKEDVALLAR